MLYFLILCCAIGLLRGVVQKWLRGPNLELLKAINGFLKNFISYQHQLYSNITYDDEELESWGSKSKCWTRVLFLIVDDMKHFDPILKVFNICVLFVYEMPPCVFLSSMLLFFFVYLFNLKLREK